MNKLDAAKFLPILKAYSEGKTIQIFLSHRKEWVDNINGELSFILNVDNYRIKPETVKYKRYLMKGMKMTKPTVQYNAAQGVVKLSWDGIRYSVTPINHPDSENVSNDDPVITSKVITEIDETGVFETQNSIYVPVFKV